MVLFRTGGGSAYGEPGPNGEIQLRNNDGRTTIHFLSEKSMIRVGGEGTPGLISVRDNSTGSGQETIRIDGDTGDMALGGHGTEGDLALRDGETRTVIHLSAQNGVVRTGGGSAYGEPGPNGEIQLRNNDGRTTIHFLSEKSMIRVGGEGTPGLISVRDNSTGSGQETIRIDGDAGDIILKNADFAEEFDVANHVDPGTVMALDPDGTLQTSSSAYNKRVVGVVSGAGGYKPGIILDKQSESHNRLPIALVGKVYCKADANDTPIEVGDLLTSSLRPGHAMKANDPAKAFGAVIGKALSPLNEGTGLIPIVVALQ